MPNSQIKRLSFSVSPDMSPEYWRPGDSAFMDYNGGAIFGQVLYRSEIVREFIAAVRGAVC